MARQNTDIDFGGEFGTYSGPREAREHLRAIRDVMERSTRHSTFSGLSGIIAGVASLAGVVGAADATRSGDGGRVRFMAVWAAVALVAIAADFVLTKRKAPTVGKTILSRLGRQMVIAAGPGFTVGAALTAYLVAANDLALVYPVWMLCYGTAVSAVGLFSQREVGWLGSAFITGGVVALFLPAAARPVVMALTFGCLHAAYGAYMGRKDGWT